MNVRIIVGIQDCGPNPHHDTNNGDQDMDHFQQEYKYNTRFNIEEKGLVLDYDVKNF